MDSINIPLQSIRAAVIQKKTVLLSLAVTFVATLGGVVINAFCADQIHKSSADKKDPHIEKAYKWSYVSAILASFIMVGSLGGMLYLTMIKKH